MPALLKSAAPEDCAISRNGDCADTDITFGAYVNITNFHHPAEVSSVSYVQLLASFTPEKEPTDFYVVSTASVLDGGLQKGDQFLNVCPSHGSSSASFTSNSSSSSSSSRRSLLQEAPAPAPTRPSEKRGDCCMGSPGGIYLVACIVKEFPATQLYDKVKFDPTKKLNEYCIQADGVCGTSCGFDTTLPKYCAFGEESSGSVDDADDVPDSARWWDNDDPRRGRIPQRLLMKPSDSEFDDDDAGSVFGSESRSSSVLGLFFHVFFIVFMTISALSLWISFLPGIGRDNDAPSPSLYNVEQHMNTKGRGDESDPLVCVAFSISASEPRMMILRNMVGKLMAWCHEHKLFLKDRPWMNKDDSKSDRAGSLLRPIDKVSFVDLFQDEGNRVGCFALWDAFSDLVDGTDLKFLEELADEMKNMTASDTVVKSNRMPRDKYVATHWSSENCKKHLLKGLKPGSQLMVLAGSAIEEIGLDGKAILGMEPKALESILKEAGGKCVLFLVVPIPSHLHIYSERQTLILSF